MGRFNQAMIVRLHELVVHCKRKREVIGFTDFNYFHGSMGAGKSTIARLVDFCLGGRLEYTPALQSEFVAASLELTVGTTRLLLTRNSNQNEIRAQWDQAGDPFDVLVPARQAQGEVLPKSGVETISDLVFRLAGIEPPMVRRSKYRDESELVRLSLRDLFWYCYLDQDSMDSSFFRLDDSNHNIRLKSLDVLRLMLGFHQQQVSELHVKLEDIRSERLKLEAAAAAIREAMTEEQLATPIEIQHAIESAKAKQKEIDSALEEIRTGIGRLRTHATEKLREICRELARELEEIDTALVEIEDSIQKDKSHKNTILHLAVRQHRAQSARDALGGVEFRHCPQCSQELPARTGEVCAVCGQIHQALPASPIDDETLDADVKARVEELETKIELQRKAEERLKRQRNEIAAEKEARDAELNRASADYDSAYLSQSLEMEKRKARLDQRIIDLRQMEILASRVVKMEAQAAALGKEEAAVRAELRELRKLAEQDTTNLDHLKKLFLDCLLRARMPGFFADDFVQMNPPWYSPEVVGKNTGDFAVTSFDTLGSGGKKTLFKCCFALAVHRLAKANNAPLPSVLILDSPMKNISERENRKQFEGFNQMLYELAASELQGTQFVVIDKEYDPPHSSFPLALNERHMTPDDPAHPGLITTYDGK
jgi:uncharacterized Zn finger protein (UPF0148 family)